MVRGGAVASAGGEGRGEGFGRGRPRAGGGESPGVPQQAMVGGGWQFAKTTGGMRAEGWCNEGIQCGLQERIHEKIVDMAWKRHPQPPPSSNLTLTLIS